jgi:hypothetical protein
MTYQGVAKVQHYVPQFLLRNFGSGKKDKIHAFDKQTGKSFEAKARNVAAESRFYDFHLSGHHLTLEGKLSQIEASAKPIIESILNRNSLAHLTPQARAKLSVFLAVQMTRGKWIRELSREFPRMLEQAFHAKAGPDVDLSGIAEHLRTPDDNELAIETVRSVLSAPQVYAPHFADKVWILCGTDTEHPFLIGDNPIGMKNMKPCGNIGLSVPGIEIYFPLSPRRLLSLWCPSHIQWLESTFSHNCGNSYTDHMLAAIAAGKVLPYPPESVMNANSIQIVYAERFVFSSDGDFSLARNMTQKHVACRRGPRPKIA